jgi:hypothetical protein
MPSEYLVPLCQAAVGSRPIFPLVVVEQTPVDDIGQLPLERLQCLFVGFPLVQLALVVGLSIGCMADLGDRHDMQRPVGLAVAAAVEPMATHVAAGRLDRRGAVDLA